MAGTAIGASGEPSAAAPQLRGLEAARIYAAFFRDPLRCFDDVARRYGPLCLVGNPLGAAQRRFAFALGPRCNERVLSDVEGFRTSGQGLSGPRGSAMRRVRNGLTRTRGEKHRRFRALFMPSLQPRAVARSEPQIAAIAREVLSDWQPGSTRDLVRDMRLLSLRVSAEVIFAIEDPRRARAFGTMCEEYLRRSFSLPVLATRWAPLPGTPYRRLQAYAERFEAAVRGIVDDRVASGLGDDVVSAMLRALEAGEDWLERDDLIGQITLLFGASYETTAQALIWAFFLLAQHPETSRALCDELAAAGPDPDRTALDALPLLDGVVKETLRLFPSIPYTMRICTAAAEIEGMEMRRGDRVLCSHYFTHRLPEIFPEPLRFDPRRWEHARPGTFEYFPFHTPPRICIGAGFSRAVLKRTIAEVMGRLRFRVAADRVDLSVRVSLGPRRALPVTLAAADGRFLAQPVAGTIRDAVHWS